MLDVESNSSSRREYSPSPLVIRLHRLPHLDMTFQKVNSDFNPDIYRYREVLLFWAVVPIVWLLLTMIVVVMFFCYHCCQTDVPRAGACLKWSIATLALLSCGAVGAGFYGNEETHKGLQHFIDAAKGIQYTTIQTRMQIEEMQRNLNTTVIWHANDLRSNIPRSHSKRTKLHQHLNDSVHHVNAIMHSVTEIGSKVERMDSTIEMVKHAGTFGFYRWLGMVLLLSWYMMLFVLLLFATGKGSKYLMLVFGILSIISLVLLWLSTGLHLGLSVGVADFCFAPLSYLEEMSDVKADKEIIEYYMKCNYRLDNNPFTTIIPSTYDHAKQANDTLALVGRELLRMLPDPKEKQKVKEKSRRIAGGMKRTVQMVVHISALAECTNLHKEYLEGISGICGPGLEGMVFFLVCIMLAGVFFSGVVLLTSGFWKSFTSGTEINQNVLGQLGSAMTSQDENPPFMVSNESASMAGNYYGNSNKSIRRASDILFRGFLPGFRPANMMGDATPFKRNLAVTPLLEGAFPGAGYNQEAPSEGGNGNGGSKFDEDDL